MIFRKPSFFSLLIINLFLHENIFAQNNLLLNGDFEDINTCTEYNAECGVEAWFYLRDVKAQMLENENNLSWVGNNSFALFFNWTGYTGFAPLIGTILPCRLQKNSSYTFKGLIAIRINDRLVFKPGVVLGQKFYVPKRSFSNTMHPDSILEIKPVPNTAFYEFEFSFIATGEEKYLTFGSFIHEDTVAGKKNPIGTQVVTVTLDNFQLLPADKNEIACADLAKNKEKIYNYNFRHKEMDYSLFGKGELPLKFDEADSNYITNIEISRQPEKKTAKADTLKLGEVFFDFNKAKLKPEAFTMMATFFRSNKPGQTIDSIYIEGHTDSIGTDTRNFQLSMQRCESVRSWLLQNSILPAGQIQIHPFGKTKPIATNSTPQGRALNRRVEMIIFRKQEK
jgi:outer membrane protein OmpA-like peptidoglycan-associated protein